MACRGLSLNLFPEVNYIEELSDLDLFLSELNLNCFLCSATQYESIFAVKVIKCEPVADSASSKSSQNMVFM